ncbi:MAG: anti-sigma factor antagonist [Proteobacteria bacterium]|nr:anti-sigma factor antagonist [Pseudomonadota bacterium]
MKVTIETVDASNALLVILDGQLDATHYERVEREVVTAIDASAHRGLVLDFAGVAFVSSAGIRTLINVIKRNRSRGGTVWLAAVRPQVHGVLEISGLPSLFRSAPTRVDALREAAAAAA